MENLDQEQAEAPESTQQEAPVEAPPEAPEAPQYSEAEQEAMSFGWHPPSSYTGRQEKFKSAEQYLKDTRRRAHYAYTELKQTNEKLAQSEQKMRELEQSNRRILEMSQQMQQRAYEEAKAKVLDEQRQAVAEGDVARFEALRAKEEKIPAPQAPQAQPQTNETFNAWAAQNTWYHREPALKAEADKYGKELLDEGVPYHRVLEAVALKMKAENPQKFQNQARAAAPAVETGGQRGFAAGTKTFNSLPADARAQCDTWVKQGLIKNREQYVRDYFEG